MRTTNGTNERVREALLARRPADTCPSEERWVALLRGELAVDEAELLRHHLEACAACAEVAGDAQQFLAAFGDLDAPAARSAPRRRALLVAAAAVVVLFGVIFMVLQQRLASPSAVERLAATLEVTVPEDPRSGSVESELVLRDGDGGERAASLAAALAPYRERRYAEACTALDDHASRFPVDREARYLAAVACLESGSLDRADTLLAVLAATAGDRRADSRQLLERLRRARIADER